MKIHLWLLWAWPLAMAQEEELPFPYVRYQFYSDLDAATLVHVRDLEYEEDTWNHPFTSDIELLSYSSLVDEGYGNALDGLELSEDVWDWYV